MQEQLLAQLLAAHAVTGFGRAHDLRAVRTYEEFVRAVPVGTYETHRPYMDRVLAGETSALLQPSQRVLMFSQTSGTTGLPKFIPVTPRSLSDARRGWNVWGLTALRDHRAAWLRYVVQLSSSMRERVSPTGLPCGAVSGLLAATQKKIVRRMYCVPPGVGDIADSDSRLYTVLRSGVDRDVAFITTANPSSTIALIETGQRHVERLIRDVRDGTFTPPGEVHVYIHRRLRRRHNAALAKHLEAGLRRDGRLLPRHFWKLSFLANWTGGTLGLYLPRLRELFDDVPIRDIGLLASEGRFSVPVADSTAAGVAEILGNFLEFIPAEEYAGASRLEAVTTLRAHEVEVGREYFLVVSNWSGLWRYNMDDRVRVVGRLGQSPMIEFLSRGLHTANITGEKITEHQVVAAMAAAGGRGGADAGAVERFVLQGRFAATPFYELRLEPRDGLDVTILASRFDEALSELNVEYHSKRKSGRLGPVTPTLLPPGTLEAAEHAAITARQGRREQYKHKYLLTEIAK
ncbi:MAG: GH3 auxin-responsive promoter family protein [Phycisphaerae bacterium]|nr:GH3 auxin-responsive promoter family protein [Phycisphaerae bacterium]